MFKYLNCLIGLTTDNLVVLTFQYTVCFEVDRSKKRQSKMVEIQKWSK